MIRDDDGPSFPAPAALERTRKTHTANLVDFAWHRRNRKWLRARREAETRRIKFRRYP